MYRVITTYDSVRDRNYYYSYKETEDANWGNVSTEELPPYQDIHKARSCYWNSATWVYDEEKYAEILDSIQKAKEEADRISSIPNNEALNEMILSVMEGVAELSTLVESYVTPLTALAGLLKTSEE